MTATVVVIVAFLSIAAGLAVGRVYVWVCDKRDEEDALTNATIRARFDANRYDDLTDELRASAPDVYSFAGMDMTSARRAVVNEALGRVYDWSVE